MSNGWGWWELGVQEPLEATTSAIPKWGALRFPWLLQWSWQLYCCGWKRLDLLNIDVNSSIHGSHYLSFHGVIPSCAWVCWFLSLCFCRVFIRVPVSEYTSAGSVIAPVPWPQPFLNKQDWWLPTRCTGIATAGIIQLTWQIGWRCCLTARQSAWCLLR